MRAFGAVTFGIIAVALTVCITGCGGGSDTARVPGVPPNFGDSNPHDWSGRTPASYPVHGIDVSRWQYEIDWQQVASAGVSFAWVKATEGGDIFDPYFNDNTKGARRAGIPVGAYHFFYHCTTAEDQARWYIRNVPRRKVSLPPVLDIEYNHVSPTCAIRPDPAKVRADIRTFQRIVGAHYGQRPVIYTTVDFWEANDLKRLRGEEFWLRSVADHPSKTYENAPWSFWQYSGTGRVKGIEGDVDLNTFSGSAEAWGAWLRRRGL